jgi:hypothetical protein
MHRLALAVAVLLVMPGGFALGADASACAPTDFTVVPADATLRLATDYALSVPCGLLVLGTIQAPSITLRSDGPVFILGALRAADGAESGTNGGSITVTAGASRSVCEASPICASASLLVGPHAIVQAGSGAPGSIGELDASCACILGGDGGDGGSVRLLALTGQAVVLGPVVAGAGGDGGAADATGRDAFAVGGDGGAAGTAVLVAADEAAVTVAQALAGNGGTATATSASSADPTSDPAGFIEDTVSIIKGENGRNVSKPCESQALLALLNAVSPVGPIGLPTDSESEDDPDRTADGGNGTAGPMEGGDGGTATANGCNRNGETAGNGTDGRDANQTCFQPSRDGDPACPPDGQYLDGEDGSMGDPGAHGGNGTARGGDGGPGLLVGGKGGDAKASGGQGGKGGRGGNGGDALQHQACRHGGNGGKGGPGGPGGNANAQGGKGGNAYFAQPIGHGGKGGGTVGSKAGLGGIGGEGGEGGKGSWDLGGSPAGVNVGCVANDGDKGDRGDDGPMGQDNWADGDNGDSGNMTLQEWVHDMTGIPVSQTIEECTRPLTVEPMASQASTANRGGCEDIYFAVSSLVAGLVRIINDCWNSLPNCVFLLPVVGPVATEAARTTAEAIATAEACASVLLQSEGEPSGEPSGGEAVDCSGPVQSIRDCLAGADRTCAAVLDLAASCVPEAQEGGPSPCGSLHNLFAMVSEVVNDCTEGHDPAPTVRACSAAHPCMENVVACSGADDYITAACDDDESEDCKNIKELAQAVLEAVLAVVDDACGPDDAECIDLMVGVVKWLVDTVETECQTSQDEDPEGCVAIVVAVVNGVVATVTARCDDNTSDDTPENECKARAFALVGIAREAIDAKVDPVRDRLPTVSIEAGPKGTLGDTLRNLVTA